MSFSEDMHCTFLLVRHAITPMPQIYCTLLHRATGCSRSVLCMPKLVLGAVVECSTGAGHRTFFRTPFLRFMVAFLTHLLVDTALQADTLLGIAVNLPAEASHHLLQQGAGKAADAAAAAI